jgi:hypothetical protein
MTHHLSGGGLMELTDEELSGLHDILFERVMYGDDEIVYGDGPEAVLARTLLEKVTDEARQRGFWWAQ